MNKDELLEEMSELQLELMDYHSQAQSDASNFQYRLNDLMAQVQNSDQITELVSEKMQSRITQAINQLECAGADDFHNAGCELEYEY